MHDEDTVERMNVECLIKIKETKSKHLTKRCIFAELEILKNELIMSELVIQMQSVEKLILLKELAVQLGGNIVSMTKNIVGKQAKEVSFVQLSVSSLSKDWDSKEDNDWDEVLSKMSAL